MGQAVLEKKKYTYEDYLKTPDDKRYELIEGELLNRMAVGFRIDMYST